MDPPRVELMTADHLTPEQKAAARVFFGDSAGWGFGMAVVTRRDHVAWSPGTLGWDGGLGRPGARIPRRTWSGSS